MEAFCSKIEKQVFVCASRVVIKFSDISAFASDNVFNRLLHSPFDPLIYSSVAFILKIASLVLIDGPSSRKVC